MTVYQLVERALQLVLENRETDWEEYQYGVEDEESSEQDPGTASEDNGEGDVSPPSPVEECIADDPRTYCLDGLDRVTCDRFIRCLASLCREEELREWKLLETLTFLGLLGNHYVLLHPTIGQHLEDDWLTYSDHVHYTWDPEVILYCHECGLLCSPEDTLEYLVDMINQGCN